MRLKINFHRFEVNEKCPEVVINYYESRCLISKKCVTNGKSDEKYELDLIDNPPPIREKNVEPELAEIKSQKSDTDEVSESIQDTTQELPDLQTSETATADSASESDVTNAAFSINVDDANAVQVSYSLPLIENQPGEELMETMEPTEVAEEQGSHTQDTSNCHMPDLQDVEMQ